MKAVGVILAAGRGMRLGKLTAEMPKGMLEVGGSPLIEKQLDALRSFGINDIYLIVGFAAEKVEKALGGAAKYIRNKRWESTNNIYSLYLARDVASNGFVLINSDDLFHPGILKSLIESPYPDAISVDDHKKLGAEEMKVKLENGFLREINKTMAPAHAHGEYIGIAKFGREGSHKLFDVLADFNRRDDLDGWYEEAFAVMAPTQNIAAVSTGGLPWAEIDTPQDWDRARQDIWPEISGDYDGKRRTKKYK